jgi:hypothetical protein
LNPEFIFQLSIDGVGIQITQKVQQSRIYSRLVEECWGGYKNASEYGDTANIKAAEWTDRGVTRGRNDVETMVRYIGGA